MGKNDGQSRREIALQALDDCGYMVLGMVSAAGEPYCVPIHGVRDGDALYFHCAKVGEKVDCLRAHPAVCLTAVGAAQVVQEAFSTAYRSALVRGTAAEVVAAEEKVYALRLICLRYTPDVMAQFDGVIQRSLARTAVWKIHMDSVTGKQKKYGKDGEEVSP